jgi:hypothetical protein
MKPILIFIIILLAAAASCKRDPLITYNTADNVYFNYAISANYYVDTMDLSFAYSDASVKDTIIALPLAVTGPASAKDRKYNLVVDPASTAVAGTHYDLPEFVVHAGKVKDTMRLLLKRAADLNTGTKKLILHLQPNESLLTGLQYRINNTSAIDTVNMLTFTIAISDILSAGPYWESIYTRYFGTFSLKKVEFIHDLLGMPLDFWSVAEPSNQQRALAIYYASVTGRYLTEQTNLGNTIYDEDGTPMKMASAYQ